ncbi:MAG TPA: OmpA family protein [Planctomycetes bacterium]|nr:OmpA family protein [Planctomycetota bacterium]
MKKMFAVSFALVLLAGCYSDDQYAAVQDAYRRSENRNREFMKRSAELELNIDRLNQEKTALKLEIARREEILKTYRTHLEWARLIPGSEVSSEGSLILRGDIVFLPGSHELTPQGKAALDEVARVISAESHKISSVRIDGHSDAAPIRKTRDKYDSNMHLSFMRAYEVYKHLEEKSRIDPAKLSIAAFGPNRPRSADAGENRRVEILVLHSE